MRRMFATLLLLGCLLSAVIPAASAKEQAFRDLNAIENRSQVMLLVDLGMISGYTDGTFRPQATINRAETAKLISLLYTDTPQLQDSAVTFTDIAGHWAESAILFCAQQGVVAGDGNGFFRPSDPVTARELAKMLLIALGSDADRYTGETWAEQVDADAKSQGIYTRFSADPALPVNRDNACLLIYNAMQSWAIDGYSEDGTVVYVMDALRNPVSFLEARFDVVRYTGVVTGNECADLLTGGVLESGVTKLQGHTAFQVSSDLSLVGQCVDIYVRNNQVVGTPCVSTSAVSYTFQSLKELKDLCQLTDYQVAADAAVYYNYVAAEAAVLDTLPENSAITVLDQDGDHQFEEVLAVTYETAVVEAVSPLTVRLAGSAVEATAARSGDSFAKGQSVRAVQVAETWYIQ